MGACFGTLSEISRILSKDQIENTFFLHDNGFTMAIVTALFTTLAASMQSIFEEKLILKD